MIFPLLCDLGIVLSVHLLCSLIEGLISGDDAVGNLLLFYLVVQIVVRGNVLAHDGLLGIKFLELAHIMSQCVHGLLAESGNCFVSLDDLYDTMGNILLHLPPHVPHILFRREEDITLVVGNEPVVLIQTPTR